MTPEEYNKDKTSIWRKNKWGYFISLSVICLGLFFHYLILFENWPDNSGNVAEGLDREKITKLFFAFYAIGVYGLWRIHAGYKFIKVASRKTIEKKRIIIKQVFEQLNVSIPTGSNDCLKTNYRGSFGVNYRIVVLLDENYYYINANSIDCADHGIVDFGMSFRLMKKIKRALTKSSINI